MSVRSCALLLCLSTLPIASVAHADAAADSDAARSLREEAVAAAKKGDFQTCKTKALESFGRAKQPQSAGLAGLCEAEVGLSRDAAEHLDYAIRFDPNSDRVPDYKAKLADMKKLVGTLNVMTMPAGATVYLDGKEVGSDPLTLFVNPGHYRLTAKKDGGSSKTSDVDITAGAEKPVPLKIDTSRPPIEPVAARPLWPGITALSVGVVSLAIGGGLMGARGSARSDAKTLGAGLTCSSSALTPPCQKVADKVSAANSFGDAAGALFIVGGVAVAGGTGLLIWAVTGPSHDAKAKEKAASISVSPVIGWERNGLVFEGSF